ncbi:uncharacterized protein METZ01_LOCUS43587 [marine metagenome]|uniref:Cell division protein FtsB n=1 Tax=marine metagenome TaxID=408172 RepID=A0A381RPC2_9ZZZZ|tara:strand:- start:157 stop:525 length:369 start_codon:yes stop_codon:yes gene_type:complete
MPRIELPLAPQQNARLKSSPPRSRRAVLFLLLFLACILLADGLIGERGFFEANRKRHHQATQKEEIVRQRQENSRLQKEAERLTNSEPRSIEAIARDQLGLIHKNEILFIIRDVKPPLQEPQ